MTIREELEKLGPERVRRGMEAIDHPGQECGCFLNFALGEPGDVSWERARAYNNGATDYPAIEINYEGWRGLARMRGIEFVGREHLRAECVAFLAEHGTAPEVAPVSLETVGQPQS